MEVQNISPQHVNPEHTRKIGLFGLSAMSVAGSTPMIFVVGAAFATQGTASVWLLLACVIISAMAVPGFIELVLMYPKKVGGIAAVLTDAYRPYNPIIGNLAGTFYWWSWFEGSSFAATLIGQVIKQLFPTLPLSPAWIATIVILACTLLSFRGMKLVSRLLIPFATAGIVLTVLSGAVPVFAGVVNWGQVFNTALKTTFGGTFGQFTSVMAGVYFLAYAVPAYETILVYVAETKDPAKTVPRAMYFGTALTLLYYFMVPAIWLGVLGAAAMNEAVTPIAPVFTHWFSGPVANVLTGMFFICNALVTCFEALNNSPRVLAQISDDALVPEFFGLRTKRDVPWASTLITSAAAIVIVWINAPAWFLAAVSFEYVLMLVFASVAVWLLRRNQPDAPRLYRAPKGWIVMGLISAGLWIISTIFGLQQFGLPIIVATIAFAFSGIIFYFWRKGVDRKRAGLPLIPKSLHLKLSGTFVSVLVLDAVGYLIAVSSINQSNTALIVVLEDIFVVVALLTLTIGFILPGTIANAAEEVSDAAQRLVKGTLRDFSNAMNALGQGRLEAAHAKIDIMPVKIDTQDEIGDMGHHFNIMQEEIKHAAIGLDGARKGLQKARDDLQDINKHLEERVVERTQQLAEANTELTATLDNLKSTQAKLIESEKLASLGGMVAGVAHEVNTPLGITITAISYFNDQLKLIQNHFNDKSLSADELGQFMSSADETLNIVESNLNRAAELITSFKQTSVDHTAEICRDINMSSYVKEILTTLNPIVKKAKLNIHLQCDEKLELTTYPGIIFQTLTVFVNNTIMHAYDHENGGEVNIDISEENDKVIIRYQDDGKGIAKEFYKKVFEPFYTSARNRGGVGLGLFVVYNKVNQIINGNIECVTPPNGKGACFVVTIPKTVTVKA